MAFPLAEAYVELQTRGLNRTGRAISGIANEFTSFARGPLAWVSGGLAAMGVGFSLGHVIGEASKVEETMNKFNVVFGENSDMVKQWSDTFGDRVGRSKEQIASFMAGTQDLFVPLGFEPGAATEMSKQITKLSIDLASFNNLDDQKPLEDLQAALTGSGEVMKKYGVLVNEAAVKNELLNMKIDPKKATDQDKVLARLNIIMAGTTAAQGDAERSSGSYANQMKRLQAEISNASAEIGAVFLPMVTKMVTWVADGVKAMQPYIETFAFAWENAGLLAAIAWEQLKINFSNVLLSIGDGVVYAVELFGWMGDGAVKGIMGIPAVAMALGEDIVSSAVWTYDNWVNIWTDLANGTVTILQNLASNIAEVFTEVWDFIRTGGVNGIDIDWTPLTQGFEATISELPKSKALDIASTAMAEQLNALPEFNASDKITTTADLEALQNQLNENAIAKFATETQSQGANGGADVGPGSLAETAKKAAGSAGEDKKASNAALLFGSQETASILASALSGFGGGDHAADTAKNTKRTADAVERMSKKAIVLIGG